MKPALFGFSVVAACVALLGYIVPDEEVRRPMWFFVFVVLAVCTKFCWSHPDAPKNSQGWLAYVGLAMVAGVVFIAIDTLLHGASTKHIAFDLFLSLCGGIVALAGYVRALFREHEKAWS